MKFDKLPDQLPATVTELSVLESAITAEIRVFQARAEAKDEFSAEESERLEYLLDSRDKVTAERLHALGLVNRLSNPGDALGTALQLADRLNQRAPNALASIKELLSDAAHQTLSQHLNSERDHFVKNLHHPNAGEGIAAFLEKRAPRYE